LTTQNVETIKAAILAVLTNGVGLTKIKKWLNSEPKPTSPFGYVEWAGGPRAPEAGGKRYLTTSISPSSTKVVLRTKTKKRSQLFT
jgi:hypothetical protein